jgi:glyoxylase-like metal-dependent hydrolase (beta-lactamase superfamily II)
MEIEMNELIYKTEKISDDLYVITETQSTHCYVIIGNKKVVVFDTGYGYESIEPYIREITDLPIMVVLSHGDPDHGLGASWFSDVYLHELDCGKLIRNDTIEMRQSALDYRLTKIPELKGVIAEEEYLECSLSNVKFHFLEEKDEIDIGGNMLEVIHTPGHSYGHIMLLDRANGRLFSGDQVTAHNVWYFFPEDEQAPFIMAKRSMKKLIKEQNFIREIYPAHDIYPIGIEYITDELECMEREIKENYKDDKPFHSFMGDGFQHRYKTVNLIYSKERLENELEG